MVARAARAPRRLARRLHRGEEGTISVVAVFAVLLFAMLLGMVMNVGRHVDGKIRLQNAADAAAYSGGVVLTRGMNTLAFTDHLLSDVFALTAFMREARDRNAESRVPGVLAAWDRAGHLLTTSNFPKFVALGQAIRQKVPREQELVTRFGDWAAASSERVLPVLETILEQQLIPEFQRAVVEAYPDVAQQAALEAAYRNGLPDRGRGPMLAALWRTNATLVGGSTEPFDRTLPVIDPEWDVVPDQQEYLDRARRQRRRYAELYLGVGGRGADWSWYHGNWHARSWNDQALVFFDREAKMCQFANLWRSFTCAYLDELLEEEYPRSNLPQVMRTLKHEFYDDAIGPTDLSNAHLEHDFTFLSVAYWRRLPESLPGLFRNPMDNDDVAYAEVRMFVPRNRLEWRLYRPSESRPDPMGAIGGQFPSLPSRDPEAVPSGAARWVVARQDFPTAWDIYTQHWTCQLVPASHASWSTILQTEPPLPEFAAAGIRLPDLGGLGTYDLGRISPH